MSQRYEFLPNHSNFLKFLQSRVLEIRDFTRLEAFKSIDSFDCVKYHTLMDFWMLRLDH